MVICNSITDTFSENWKSARRWRPRAERRATRLSGGQCECRRCRPQRPVRDVLRAAPHRREAHELLRAAQQSAAHRSVEPLFEARIGFDNELQLLCDARRALCPIAWSTCERCVVPHVYGLLQVRVPRHWLHVSSRCCFDSSSIATTASKSACCSRSSASWATCRRGRRTAATRSPTSRSVALWATRLTVRCGKPYRHVRWTTTFEYSTVHTIQSFASGLERGREKVR